MKQFGDFIEVYAYQHEHVWISAKHVVFVQERTELNQCNVVCDNGVTYNVMMSAPAFLNKLDQTI